MLKWSRFAKSFRKVRPQQICAFSLFSTQQQEMALAGHGHTLEQARLDTRHHDSRLQEALTKYCGLFEGKLPALKIIFTWSVYREWWKKSHTFLNLCRDDAERRAEEAAAEAASSRQQISAAAERAAQLRNKVEGFKAESESARQASFCLSFKRDIFLTFYCLDLGVCYYSEVSLFILILPCSVKDNLATKI